MSEAQRRKTRRFLIFHSAGCLSMSLVSLLGAVVILIVLWQTGLLDVLGEYWRMISNPDDVLDG